MGNAPPVTITVFFHMFSAFFDVSFLLHLFVRGG